MDIMEAGQQASTGQPSKGFIGIPLVAVVGLPLLALLIVLFVGFALTLQSQRADLTKAYAERTSRLLARDLANGLKGLYMPVEQYADALARELEQAKCGTADCAFDIIRRQSAVRGNIPPQISNIRFGASDGRMYSIFKLDTNDPDYLGVIRTADGDRAKLVLEEPGAPSMSKPYNLFEKGWYRSGMISGQPIWSAPFEKKNELRRLPGGGHWSMTRVMRIDTADGRQMGVLGVDMCINRFRSLLSAVTGEAVEKISIHSSSNEQIFIKNDTLTVTRGMVGEPGNMVPLNVQSLGGWSVAVKLGPQLSKQLEWDWRYSLVLLGGLIFSMVLATAAAAFVVKPVMRLSRAVVDVGELKLDKPIVVPGGIREIGTLAAIIEKMRIVLHRNQTRLEFLAYHDSESGILNQAGLNKTYDGLSASHAHMDLILIKISNYNQIAGIFGDAVLAGLIADKIDILRTELEGGVPGCLNNNQIVYILPGEEAVEPARIQQLLAKMRMVHEVDGIRLSPNIVCAIASRLDERDEFSTLLRRANGAMHHAEETHSEEAVWYNPALIQDLRAALEFSGDITGAIARGEFSMSYQPVVELATGRICQAQASVTWHHPEFGDIKSARFIPILERNGSIRHLGLFVISRAFEFLHGFKRRNAGRTLQVSVKLSFLQLMDPLFIERITELQAEWGVKAAEVNFIITQNAALLEDQQIVLTMRKLRKLGFHLTIDQFAMGHATVNGVTALQYDGMMIGDAVYRGIEQPGIERLILEAACELARKLGMVSTAVGIDNHAIIEPLIGCGCAYGRGPWFGKSCNEQEFLRRYRENASMFAEDEAELLPG
jgi:EAL domain-containing protein (putative c-di-GMP-specific phosphodiesterase class I)/GGDEF domain-containing protein